MSFHGTLFGFQQLAVDRVLERRKLLVAYDMGLGKTVITIAAIESLIDDGKVEAGLVICSASLQFQWKKAIAQFTKGEAEALVITGTPAQRARQYHIARYEQVEYIILTYDQIRNDWQFVRDLPRDFMVLDEATAIKSFKAKRSKKVKSLDAPYKLALTGQPIENRAEEVYSIMEWVDPTVLGRWDLFDTAFIKRNFHGGVQYYKNLPALHRRLSEAMVRKNRDDPDVRDQLPKVTEELLLIDFDRSGAKLYRHIAAELLEEIENAVSMMGNFNPWALYHGGSEEENAMRGKIMSKLLCLRMLCDHPQLLEISAAHFESGKMGSEYANELVGMGMLEAIKATPKLDATLDLIGSILATEGSKIVLFSFFKATLGILQEALWKGTSEFPPVDSVQFTGDMSARQRDEAKARFQTDPECRVFLSSDAGGYGVDLPQANYLINYDLPWSSGKLEQRNARIRRLSSEWEAITVLNMLMAGSIEERQYAMLEQKHAIASAIVDGKGIDKKGRLTLDLASLSSFLGDNEV